jgi:hypothetical protein
VADRADQSLLDALAAVAAALASSDAPSMIIGGIAVIARGVPRHTIDIDATIWAEALDPERLLVTSASHRLVPRLHDTLEFARRHQVLLLQHEPTGIPVDLSLAWLPFERLALERAEAVDFGGVMIRVATAEDLIIYKAVAWRDRDRADVERLLIRHGDSIDLDRVRSVVREFALALDDPARIDQLEALITRARGADHDP